MLSRPFCPFHTPLIDMESTWQSESLHSAQTLTTGQVYSPSITPEPDSPTRLPETTADHHSTSPEPDTSPTRLPDTTADHHSTSPEPDSSPTRLSEITVRPPETSTRASGI